jgi:hypothetical protein
MKRSDYTENSNTFSVEKDGKLFHNNRLIGYIEKISKGNYLLVKNEKESGRFRKMDAWSIPHCLVRCIGSNGVVYYKTEKRTYKINHEDIIKYGKFLYFKNSKTEKKIYVPVKYWSVR